MIKQYRMKSLKDKIEEQRIKEESMKKPQKVAIKKKNKK